MTFWSPANIKTVTAGTWIVRPDEKSLRPMHGVSIDTRTITPGQVFVALHGEHFDAHDFLEDAAESGSPLLIVENALAVTPEVIAASRGAGILRVPDTSKALVKMAAAYRQTLDGTKVIAVTGSNGKTTTVRLINAVLGSRLRGSASIKSFNNIIGVPLTVLGAKPGDQYLICECGMNSPGELAALSKILEPDIAVITSIGRAHLAGLGSLEAIAREKAAICTYLRPSGVAVVTADSPQLAEYMRPIPHIVTFGRDAKADLRLTSCQHIAMSGAAGAPLDALRFTVNDRWTHTLPLLGEHNALNALAAIAVGRRLGLDEQEIESGFATVKPAENRFARKSYAGIDIYDDSYNASPESMAAAVRTFAALTTNARRRVLILGDMLELGEQSAIAHEEVGEIVTSCCNPDLLISVGPMALLIAERFAARSESRARLMILSEMDDAQAVKVAERLQPGDAVLIKASRRMGLDRITKAVEKRARTNQPATTT